MRDAFLFGEQRGRRSVDERLGKLVAGVVIAAILCAGCVGWSFISKRLIGQDSYGSRPSSTPSATVTPR
ncbi:hypothetical protein ACFQVC_04645 [Streptomyces monticola]|uniref:Uncharacterized protein n=1 Tax=Streptomyces monticola TaxID=2666263 RepID=A0ABW2JBY4_9ACTN